MSCFCIFHVFAPIFHFKLCSFCWQGAQDYSLPQGAGYPSYATGVNCQWNICIISKKFKTVQKGGKRKAPKLNEELRMLLHACTDGSWLRNVLDHTFFLRLFHFSYLEIISLFYYIIKVESLVEWVKRLIFLCIIIIFCIIFFKLLLR